MRILGIESSCDETAAAVVEDGVRVLSNVVYTQIARHAPYGGVVPEIASRAHLEVMPRVLKEALDQAGCGWADIDAIAVTRGPGLAPALMIGVSAATPDQIRAAEPHADYLGIGPLRDTATKPDADAALGPARVAALAAGTRLPAVTIGGVLPGDLPALREAGLSGVAVVSGICAAADPGAAARDYLRHWAKEAVG